MALNKYFLNWFPQRKKLSDVFFTSNLFQGSCSQFFNFVHFHRMLDEQPENPLLSSQRACKTDSNRHDFQMLLTCLAPDLEENTSEIRVDISEACFMAQTCSEKIFYRIYFYLCVPVRALILLMATGTILVVR